MLVSGIPMHRIKDTDPHADTLEKMRAVRPVVGQVLDTATGLGYTAIEAAKTAAHVTTIELDPAALEVCRRNPWSQALFDNPKITQVVGDSFEVVLELREPPSPASSTTHRPLRWRATCTRANSTGRCTACCATMGACSTTWVTRTASPGTRSPLG